MKHKKDFETGLLIVVCILINYVGKMAAERLALPIWMDSIGTVFSAYVFGPLCGAIVGMTVNMIYSLHAPVALLYSLTNISVGVTVGICAKKGFLRSVFGVLSTAFAVTVLSVFISTPLNYFLADGFTGNIWGDGVSKLLQEMGCHAVISNIVGEFYLDFLDKVLSLLLLYFVVHLNGVRRKKREKEADIHQRKGTGEKNKHVVNILLLLPVFLVFSANATVYAQNGASGESKMQADFSRYIHTVYNGENGLPGGASNDIAQTKDGVLWIGTFGGLYRYSGNDFKWMNDFEAVKTVNCLYTDEAGRLWIGTNDNGIAICTNQKIVNVVGREDGLPSDSVRCITESSEGYYYVGTTDSLVVMTLLGGLKVYETIPEIVYADSISADQNGNVAVVTNEGGFYLLHGTQIISSMTAENEGESYNCCAFDEEGRLYLGTSSNRIEVYEVAENRIEKLSTLICGNLVNINSIHISEDHVIFVCADNGVGYLQEKKKFCSIDTGSFSNSIDHVLIDYQGNLWFTSSRLGLLRMCPSVFSELYEEAGFSENVVNTVTKWQGNLYFGTDNGLDAVSVKSSIPKHNALTQMLSGVRIRCLMVDSANHLWICTSGKGLYEVSGDGEVKNYDSKTGMLGDKLRSAIETADGTIVVSGDYGISFIQDKVVSDTIGSAEGLTNPRVLTLYECSDGSILAGTDGNGIAVIKDGKVTGTIRREDGLSSDIILKIVPNSDDKGLFIITSNGLCYVQEDRNIRVLDNFPYYNNFDVVEGNNGELFVLCSAGIYVVDKEDLLAGGQITYELLDAKKGLRIGLTPNSFPYMDETDELYLCGDRGVICFNLNQYDITERSYRMLLTQIEVDGENYSVEKGEPIRIPRGAEKIDITPEIVNFSIHDPEIRIYLEGFDQKGRNMLQSEMNHIIYTNLPSGEYRFHIAVLDSKTGGVIAENSYQIIKEKEIYDNWWFRLYMGSVAVLFIAYLTWLLFRTQIQKTLRMQRMELEWTKRQLQMGNETIMTIAQAVDAKDKNTSQHSVRVSEYSVMIARRLGYDEEACEQLRRTAVLHDIGKIGIPDRILNKPDKLTDEEYDIMKSHVDRGAEILKNFTLIDRVEEGVLYHHERYDGRGYTHGLKGEDIPLNARIIGIADAFDAMTANRVYRKKLDFTYVLSELEKGKGTQFDPKLVEILLGLIEDGTIDVKQMYQKSDNKETKDAD